MDVITLAECFMCEQERPAALRIGPMWCCAECEQRVVSAEVGSDEYEDIIIGMQRLWEGLSMGSE